MAGTSNESVGAKPGRGSEVADRSWRGRRSPGAPAAPTVRFAKIARIQHGESAEGTANTELACCPNSRGGRRPPCSPCPPRFLRAKNLAALRRHKRRRHPWSSRPHEIAESRAEDTLPWRGARRECVRQAGRIAKIRRLQPCEHRWQTDETARGIKRKHADREQNGPRPHPILCSTIRAKRTARSGWRRFNAVTVPGRPRLLLHPGRPLRDKLRRSVVTYIVWRRPSGS